MSRDVQAAGALRPHRLLPAGEAAAIASDNKACRGKFATAAQNRKLPNGNDARQIVVACEDGKSTVTIIYAFYPLKGGGYWRISNGGLVAADSYAADQKFFDVISESIKHQRYD